LTRVVLNVIDDTLHPIFDESDAWVTETGAAMLFWASPAVATTRNFYKGPYRYAGSLLGSNPFLSSPATIPIPFPADLGQRVFIRARVTQADGRLSSSVRLPADTSSQAAPNPGIAGFFQPPFGTAFAIIPFDQLIKQELHSTANWFVRKAAKRYPISNVRVFGSIIRLDLRSPIADPGLDVVVFSPPPFDVHGLLNGVPTPAFQIRIV
jgi:hypothetical protein